MIAIDWGTSSFRAYRVGPGGIIHDRRAVPRGILAVEGGDFAPVLAAEIAGWTEGEPGPVVMSGMIGSRQGWREVPYLDCPADPAALARGCVEVAWGEGRRAFIVPGLACRDRDGIPDVMRGEETQILGALDAIGPAATVCLPGTHSKYARLRDGRIEGFETHMTGEAFGVLWRHGILGRLGSTEEVRDPAAFDAGVDRSAQTGGLLHHIFGVRARGLFGELPTESLASYLSGILIGHEIRAATVSSPVAVIGAAALAALYCRAFLRCGIEASVVPGEPAAMGLWRIAEAMGV
ncbi:MAG TPA: 2-dehydro-3-deoxygalactonokinase [Stellaceae bacterium]|nr:2-dehydro-3-deoxygalactonokinase [Stellaceae bacterium]